MLIGPFIGRPRFQPAPASRTPLIGREQEAAVAGGRIVAAESAYYIELQQPEIVIDAVREIVEAVRDPASCATPTVITPPFSAGERYWRAAVASSSRAA